jgi:hypothetical protein
MILDPHKTYKYKTQKSPSILLFTILGIFIDTLNLPCYFELE